MKLKKEAKALTKRLKGKIVAELISYKENALFPLEIIPLRQVILLFTDNTRVYVDKNGSNLDVSIVAEDIAVVSEESLDINEMDVSATKLLQDRVVDLIWRHREKEVCIQFTDGTRMFVDRIETGLEISITAGRLRRTE
ncbi:hypothetical protein ACFL2A_03305 [Thermodesulfobacteriota bacterium]